MQYTTIVEHSEEGLNLIFGKTSQFEREAVFDGVISMKYNTYQIMQISNDVREFHNKLKREILAIVEFSKTFNQHFATDNNECFAVADVLFRKIRNSVSGTKKIYRKFCKKMKARYPGSSEPLKVSALSHSFLAKGNYSKDIFGEENFPPEVIDLCNEIERFFNDVTHTIMLCLDVLEKEKEVKNDLNALLNLYNKDSDMVRKSHKKLLAMLKASKTEPTIDPMSMEKQKKTLQAFLKDAFHKFTTDDFVLHIINEEIKKGKQNGLDEEESIYWGEHPEIVPDVRLVIEHFDELEPQGQKNRKLGKYKISSIFMLRLIHWSLLDGSGYEAPFIENYFKKHYHGEFLPINASSVSMAKKKYVKKNDTGYDVFLKKVDDIIAKHRGKQTLSIPIASNF